MPGMDGLALLREMRNDSGLKDVPVILLTAHLTRSLAREARDLAATVLSKPVEADELLAAVRKVLQTSISRR